MRHLLTVLFILVSMTIFGQVNDSESFFDGNYDKNYIQQHKIKQISLTVFIDSNQALNSIFDLDIHGFLTKMTVLDTSLKKLREYSFLYNEHSDLAERTEIDYEASRTHTMKFDREYKGQLMVQEYSSEMNYFITHFYNDEGRKIESIKSHSRDTMDCPKRIYFYTYDLNGKLKSIQEVFHLTTDIEPSSVEKSEYIYDELGMVSSIIRKKKSNYFYTYSKDGLLRSQKIVMPKDLKGMGILGTYSYIFWK